jgi:hypothetical protein
MPSTPWLRTRQEYTGRSARDRLIVLIVRTVLQFKVKANALL